ncbi:MAG: hypothetical protein ACK6CE_06135 [Planctomycetota bacterium]|nr:hypothetical protein [Blastopirellula sp.]
MLPQEKWTVVYRIHALTKSMTPSSHRHLLMQNEIQRLGAHQLIGAIGRTRRL